MKVNPLPVVTANDLLLTAYARAESTHSVDMSELDYAVEVAKRENPGRYEAIVEAFKQHDEESQRVAAEVASSGQVHF